MLLMKVFGQIYGCGLADKGSLSCNVLLRGSALLHAPLRGIPSNQMNSFLATKIV